MPRGIPTMLFLACAALWADTLTLKNGKVVQGTFVGGDARQIRIAVADRVETFPLTDVDTIRFGTAAPAKPVEAVAPSAAAQPVAASEVFAPPARTSQPPIAPETRAPEATGAAARSVPAAVAKEVPAGSQIVVRMIDDIDSEKHNPGQVFRASLDDDVLVDGKVAIPKGADATILLVEDKEAGKLTGRTELTIDLQSIVHAGKKLEVDTQAITQQSGSRTKRTAGMAGGGAALGAIIGAIAGGGRGAAIGAASGAAAGTGVQIFTKGPKVRIPSESRLTFTLQAPIRL